MGDTSPIGAAGLSGPGGNGTPAGGPNPGGSGVPSIVKVWVDSERCQGHAVCSMIAPDSFQLSDIDGSSSAIGEVVPADREDQVRQAAHSCPEQAIMHYRRNMQGDSTLSVDGVVSDSDRKRNRYHFGRHSAEYRSQFKAITEEMHAQCPMAWSDTYGGHWVRPSWASSHRAANHF
jgi:ferredoxin